MKMPMNQVKYHEPESHFQAKQFILPNNPTACRASQMRGSFRRSRTEPYLCEARKVREKSDDGSIITV